MATVMFADFDNRSRQRLLALAGAPCLRWDPEQNRRLRTCGATFFWEVSQICGCYFKPLRETLG